MANRVAGAIRDNAVLVCEAGTGTGKTFAYLVPALLSAGKVILSTGTKTLQDQLYHRDLPTVRAALNVPVTTALLKGRANYVCHYHLERNLGEGGPLSREVLGDLQRIVSFARATRTGDKSEFADVPEDAPAWALATSTRENCLGQSCPRFGGCLVMAGRREALAADIVVVNHHLFFADVMLKDEGMAELLPACNSVIFDEAHQLPETATLFFGETLSTGQLIELARDIRAEALSAAKDMPDPPRLTAALDKAARDLRLALPGEAARFTAASVGRKRVFSDALTALDSALRSVCAALDALSERSEGLARCSERARTAQALLERWRDETRADLVRWVEVFSHSLRLNATPLSIAAIFHRQLDGHPRGWIFTSATLAVAGDFSHYRGEMGLDDARTACWDSPFDYASQALLYVPKKLPDPNSDEHTRAGVARRRGRRGGPRHLRPRVFLEPLGRANPRGPPANEARARARQSSLVCRRRSEAAPARGYGRRRPTRSQRPSWLSTLFNCALSGKFFLKTRSASLRSSAMPSASYTWIMMRSASSCAGA